MTSHVLLTLLIMKGFFRCSYIRNILPFSHNVHVVVHLPSVVMTERMEESFSLDEFEASVMENAALPNVDNLTTCTCWGPLYSVCRKEDGTFTAVD